MAYLNEELPVPLVEDDGLDAPYWEAARQHKLKVQRCTQCKTFQWGPEWICHHCLSYDVEWVEIEGSGRIHSWQRVWHPIPASLKDKVPYLIVLVELPHAGNIKMIGNLLGDGNQPVEFGAKVTAVFEDHDRGEQSYTLVQWQPD
jgi:uncharacterized OB-fold protein